MKREIQNGNVFFDSCIIVVHNIHHLDTWVIVKTSVYFSNIELVIHNL